MIRNITEYLEHTAERYADKAAFVDSNRSLTFGELRSEAYHIAQGIMELGIQRQPVIIFLDKSVEVICGFVGVAKSGNFYSPMDTSMPEARIQKIVSTLQPAAILTDEKHRAMVESFAAGATILLYEELMQREVDTCAVQKRSEEILDSDLLYVLFTSGSTGMPKGVMVSEQGVIDFVEWATEEFEIDDSYIFGNQSPFYFSFPIWEIYLTLRNGCTTYIIPKELFAMPAGLMQYLDDHKINTIIWVPSALSMLSTFNALHSPHVDSLKNIWFGAEVMPMKHLNKWRAAYPEAKFANLYGPTEVTDTASAYVVARAFDDAEMLPIGEACRNKQILLLDENDSLCKDGEIGEICVRGRGIAYGYYNEPEKTAEVFVQNPLNKLYPDRMYRTGDLGKVNEHGELIYVSRKDFQIKHMGNRVELGEIEASIASLDEIESVCCLYDKKHSRIYGFYVGNIEEKALAERLKSMLPEYMRPNRRVKLDSMPLNLNGKVDRKQLYEMM